MTSTESRFSVVLAENSTSDFQEEITGHVSTGKTFDVDSGTYTIVVSKIDDNGEAFGEAVMRTNLVIEPCEPTTKTINGI